MAVQQLTREQLQAIANQYAPNNPRAMMGIFGIESGYGANPRAYQASKLGIIGPGQIMSKQLGAKYGNFEQYAAPGMQNPLDPMHSAAAAARMYNDLLRKYKDPRIAAYVYHSGTPNPSPKRSDGGMTTIAYGDNLMRRMGQEPLGYAGGRFQEPIPGADPMQASIPPNTPEALQPINPALSPAGLGTVGTVGLFGNLGDYADRFVRRLF